MESNFATEKCSEQCLTELMLISHPMSLELSDPPLPMTCHTAYIYNFIQSFTMFTIAMSYSLSSAFNLKVQCNLYENFAFSLMFACQFSVFLYVFLYVCTLIHLLPLSMHYQHILGFPWLSLLSNIHLGMTISFHVILYICFWGVSMSNSI